MRPSRADRSLLTHWWYTVDHQLMSAVLALIGTGLVLSLAASPVIALKRGLAPFHFAERHLLFAAAGALLVFVLSNLRPVEVRRVSLGLLLASLALMVLVLATGPEIKGAQRWVQLGGFQLQPSELLKPAFVVISAWLFAEQSRRSDVPAFAVAIALFGLVITLLVLQPDIGQSLLIALVWGTLLFLSGRSLRRVLLLVGAAAIALVAAYHTLAHVHDRIDRFMAPPKDGTSQIARARQSFIEGGWFGRGPGEGTIKSVLPDAHTDFIMAVVAEEYGVLACLVLVGLYGFVVLRALVHIWDEPDSFVRNATIGLTLLLAFQMLINMGVNVGLLPAKGMTLPFISYGGSSLLGMSIAMGLLLALTRRRPTPGRVRNTIVVPSEDVAREPG